ncbi:S41 family peptidase [Hyphobacterium sp. HN65]|uniref:S41 family peptidase n=1 Tax=Hyphobacterium lacteum TaxID=3116575 RepID=A0ABU7LR32_9PROT|nr:S41 family peptidase [Hyphobacterium sp. HN65]MEE2526373.1 S41 family peptidase [Hyphobacterium sp. HN65]
MKIMVLMGRVGLGLVSLLLVAAVVIFSWLQFGDWQTRAVQDVQFVHDTILAHHPGPVDPENPEFLAQMDEALARAMPLAEAARTAFDHRAALDAYTDTFADGHLYVQTVTDAFGAFSRYVTSRTQEAGREGIEITDNSAWITILSFNARNSQIASVTENIEAQAETLRELDTIVFDLRGNRGGDSSFATRITRALWTAEVFLDWVPASAEGVDWRATEDNAAHVYAIAQRHAENGRQRTAEAWTGIADRIHAAALAGDDYVYQNFNTRQVTRTLQSPVSADVFVITDGACASSCLNFMDQLMSLPGVVHIGEETGSDTQYIDNRRVALPSRAGRLSISLKVYRGRLRPPGGTYVPQIEADAASLDASSLAALMQGR